MSPEEVKAIATAAAKEAVKETLMQLGMSSVDPIEVQKDMAHLRNWRKAVEGVQTKGLLTMVTILLTGAIGMFVIGFKDMVNK
jgi:2-iminoacetate synthase ThiH